jgi:chemotaxis protein methyltransferase CheR
MSEEDFRRCSRFIQEEYGIKMPPAKKTLLECRLRKRIRALGMRSFEEYVEYAFRTGSGHDELIHMIDEVTTNKTDFFREPAHFQRLVESVVPELLRKHGAGSRRPLRVWSAGCSTGEEAYTLAMVLSEFREKHQDFAFQILATDVSTKALDVAGRAVYREERIDPVPEGLRRKYFMRSRERKRALVRVVPELREKVAVRRLNFMEEAFKVKDMMDVIFCRNVMIYFEKATQERLVNVFCEHLLPGGFLFVGHSETLHGMNISLIPTAPMVYRKAD